MTALEIAAQDENIMDVQGENPNTIVESAHEEERSYDISQRGATFRLLGYINERVRFVDDEENRWLYSPAYPEPVIENLALELGISMPALQKRIRTSQVDYGYLVTQKAKSYGSPIVNVGLTPLGTTDLAKYTALQKAPLGVEESSNPMLEVEYMTMTCIELARELGKYSIVKNLQAAREEKLVLEMNKEELGAELERVMWTLESLRKVYVERIQAQRQVG